MRVHQREFWNGPPERSPDSFQAIMPRGARTMTATCEVWTHVFGWGTAVDNGWPRAADVGRRSGRASWSARLSSGASHARVGLELTAKCSKRGMIHDKGRWIHHLGRHVRARDHRRVPRLALIMSGVLQSEFWDGHPLALGTAFKLRKRKGDTDHVAVCELWSHLFGWELRLLVDGELLRSQFCRTGGAWITLFDLWKTKLLEKGWA